MTAGKEVQVDQFSPRELAYLEYVDSQVTLGKAALSVVTLEAELEEAKAGVTSGLDDRDVADKVFRHSLANVHEAIEGDETLDPLQKYIWSASFAWAAGERSVTASTDLVAFASGFQDRVETIQARMVEGAPIIAVDWRADNTVVAGILQGDKFVVGKDGIKTPAIDGTSAWIGWGHPGEWQRFDPEPQGDLTLFGNRWLHGSDPLENTDGLDILHGWDKQPGFAREQRIFIGVEEIKGFLNNSEEEVNDRFHGLIAAGFAGVDIASLENELPSDLLEQRNEVAADIAEAIAANILSDAISASQDDSLRKSTREHVERTEILSTADLLLYLTSIGISSDRLVGLVSTQLGKMGEQDYVLKIVIPQVLTDDQIAARVSGVFEETPEAIAV